MAQPSIVNFQNVKTSYLFEVNPSEVPKSTLHPGLSMLNEFCRLKVAKGIYTNGANVQMVQGGKKKPNGAECKSHAWCFVNVSCQERFNQSTLQKIFLHLVLTRLKSIRLVP